MSQIDKNAKGSYISSKFRFLIYKMQLMRSIQNEYLE